MKELLDRPRLMRYRIVPTKVYLDVGPPDGMVILEFKTVYYQRLSMWISSVTLHHLKS
ncbi:Peptidase_M28 domain-containing protein [Psidium guajava]|nr:Peptidase_M28 domain-containing protein [Psidium guajava]